MTIKFNTALRNAIVDLITANLGTYGSELNIYTGAAPATADTVASGTLLATITTASGFTVGASGATGLVATESATAVATGTAGWARWADSGGSFRVDGTVGTTGTDFIINSTAIISAGTVTLTALNLTQPAS